MECSTALLERMIQFAPLPPEEVQQAEGRLLAMFKGDRRPSEQ
jgi:hypothetical protein